MPRRSWALRPPCFGTRLAFNRHNRAHSSGFLLASLSKMPRPGFAPAPHVSAPGHFRSRLTTTRKLGFRRSSTLLDAGLGRIVGKDRGRVARNTGVDCQRIAQRGTSTTCRYVQVGLLTSQTLRHTGASVSTLQGERDVVMALCEKLVRWAVILRDVRADRPASAGAFLCHVRSQEAPIVAGWGSARIDGLLPVGR
jgi:hypothetical protein